MVEAVDVVLVVGAVEVLELVLVEVAVELDVDVLAGASVVSGTVLVVSSSPQPPKPRAAVTAAPAMAARNPREEPLTCPRPWSR